MLITGTSGDDTLVGTSDSDTIQGGGGDDLLYGSGGADRVLGGAGNDELRAGSGQDSFVLGEAGAGNADLLFDFASGWDNLQLDLAAFSELGAAGDFAVDDDRFHAAAGATGGQDAEDRIVFNTSTGELFYDADGSGAGAAELIALLPSGRTVAASDLHVFGSSPPGGGDIIRGTEGDDSLVGTEADDSMEGLGGEDTLDGAAGADTMAGGEQSDVYIVDDPGDVVLELEGGGSFDEVRSSVGYTLPAWVNNLVLEDGSDVELSASGNELDNVIRNELSSSPMLFVDGQGGDDTLVGGATDTWYTFQGPGGDWGDDVVQGGSGLDVLDLFDKTAMALDMRAGTMTGGGSGSLGFSAVERILAGSFDDVVIADDSGVELAGDLGDDTLVGGAGGDYLSGDEDFRDREPSPEGGNDSLEGGDGEDTLVGWNGSDTLDGGAGNDTLDGSDGFGSGADLFRFSVAPGAANADLISSFLSGEDSILLDGNVHGDAGPSGELAAGDERFFAGAGASSGQDASDRVVYNTSTGELWYDADGSGAGAAQLIATLEGAPSLAASDISIINGDAGGGGMLITGTSGRDNLVGTDGDDTLQGFGGSDTLNGGTGNDTLEGGGANDDYVLANAPGAANADVFVGYTSGVDDVMLGNGAFTNIGSLGKFGSSDARFFAGAGATSGQDGSDRIIYDTSTGQLYYDADGSGAGASQLIATLQGSPTLVASDIIVFAGGTNDPGEPDLDEGMVIDGTPGDDSLEGGAGDDTLNGFAGNDTLRGHEGNDLLDGGEGTDTLDGGLGDDTYVALFGDTLVDAGGVDTVIAPAWNLEAGFENLTLRPPADMPETGGTGNELDNVIRNESALSAFLDGAGGDDTIVGGSGFDFVTLSAGNDSVDGGGGTNWLSGGSVNFRTGTGTTGTGTTTFINIAAAVGSAASDVMVADDAGRQLFAEEGNDTLTGGAGDDELWGDGAFDHPDTGTGEDLIAGGAGEDFLRGGGGDDTLDGGAGNDTLTGQGEGFDGADSFVFSVAPGAANADQITDFVSGSDAIVLDGDAHANTGASGGFGSGDDRFFAGAGANAGQDAEDRVVYDTNTGQLWYDADGNGGGAAQLIATLEGAPALAATDIVIVDGSGGGPDPEPGEHLVGTGGSDDLVGGAGDDTLEGLGGPDGLDGREGNDTLSGGGANDDFLFTVAPGAENADTLTDFATGVDDLYVENAVHANLGSAGKFAAADARFFAGDGATSGQDASDRIVYDTSTGDLYYDADGSGSGTAELMATFQGAPTIVASDIIVF